MENINQLSFIWFPFPKIDCSDYTVVGQEKRTETNRDIVGIRGEVEKIVSVVCP